MVYCNYIENTDDSVTYAYGGDVEDITGKVIFHFKTDLIEISRHPVGKDAPIRHLKRLYGVQRDNFNKNIFKEKIAYES